MIQLQVSVYDWDSRPEGADNLPDYCDTLFIPMNRLTPEQCQIEQQFSDNLYRAVEKYDFIGMAEVLRLLSYMTEATRLCGGKSFTTVQSYTGANHHVEIHFEML